MFGRALKKLYSSALALWRGIVGVARILQTYVLDATPLWWLSRRRRAFLWLAILALVALIATLFVNNVIPLSDPNKSCKARPFYCGVVTSATATVIVVLLASVVWIGVAQQFLVIRRYRKAMYDTPEAFLEGAHFTDSLELLSRRSFCLAVLDELRLTKEPEPVLIVGESGSGKTTFLLSACQELARRGLIPIPIALGGTQLPVSLDQLARERFMQLVDRYLWAIEHGDRIWRRLRRAHRLVLVLDALDEASHTSVYHDWSQMVATMLSSKHLTIPTLLTTRAQSVPDSLRLSRFDLPPLTIEEALRGASAASGASQSSERLTNAIRNLGAQAVPFFLSLIQYGPDTLSGTTATQMRVSVLDSWLAPLLTAFPEELPLLAVAFLQLNTYHAPIESIAETIATLSGISAPSLRLHAAIDASVSYGILRAIHGSSGEMYQLRHPLLLVALASNATVDVWDATAPLWRKSRMPELAEALAWTGIRTNDHERAFRNALSIDSEALALVAVARIAYESHVPLPAEAESLTLRAEWRGVTHKLEFVRLLRDQVASRVWSRMMARLLQDDTYAVRWEAASVIAETTTSVDAMKPLLLVDLLSASEPGYRASHRLVLQEGPLWFGPSLVSHSSDPALHAAFHRLTDLVRCVSMAGEEGALGSESSLAQGVKLAITQGAAKSELEEALEVTRNANFWFARLESVLTAAYLPGADDFAKLIIAEALRDPHPFVRAAAKGVERVVKGEPAKRWVWLNERQAIMAPSQELDRRTLMLLGDVVLILSLCAQGSQAERDNNALRNVLPGCMRESRARSRLIEGGCPEDCEFGMCPYGVSDFGYWNRGPFPPAFSRSIRHAVMKYGPPDWYSGSSASYLSFWRSMELRGKAS